MAKMHHFWFDASICKRNVNCKFYDLIYLFMGRAKMRKRPNFSKKKSSLLPHMWEQNPKYMVMMSMNPFIKRKTVKFGQGVRPNGFIRKC